MTAYRQYLSPDGLAIYLFHGVVPERHSGVRNYTLKHLGSGEFTEICSALADQGEPVDLESALAMLAGEEDLPPNAFLFSFDDGFRNNLTVAAPILERFEIPAVVYCTTGFVGENGTSWVDLIEEALERTSQRELRLPWRDISLPCGSVEERIAMVEEVRSVVKSKPEADPYEIAGEIRDAAGVGPFEPDPELDQKLSWDEVRELASSDLFTVGGHGHTHRILSYLDDGELEDEIDTSMELLGRELEQPIRHYSYPEGMGHCYSDQVINALKQRGIVSSPTAIDGINRPGADPFHLRRVMVDIPQTVGHPVPRER